MTSLPEALQLAGVVSAPIGGVARKATSAGKIVDILASSGSIVQRGEAVLTITGPEYIAAQQALIDLHTGKRRPMPKFEDIGRIADELRSHLRNLKFPRKQITQLHATRTIINPTPILANRMSVVLHSCVAGQDFDFNDTLFSLATDIWIHAPIKQDHADFLRPEKTVTVTFEDGTQMAGIFKKLLGVPGETMREARILVANHVAPIGQTVAVGITFKHWERIDPEANSLMWPYDRAPRGDERLSILRALGVTSDQVSLASRTAKKAVPPVAPANPFAPGIVRSKRPRRAASSPFNTRLLAAPKVEIARTSLAVAASDFADWAISTTCVTNQSLAPEWRCPAQVIETGRREDISVSTAPVDGIFHPAGWRAGDLLRAGTRLGHIETSDQFEISSDSGPSQRAGSDTSRIHPVYARHDGVAVNDCGTRRQVAAGDIIATVNTVNMYIFRSAMPDIEFAKMPRVVTASLATTPSHATEYINRSALITVQSQQNGNTDFRISFPTEAGVFKKGYGRYLLLTDESARRDMLCVPSDAIARIGQSSEVLIYSEVGKLTPAPVKCGATYGEHTEIISGLGPGHFVVRDLALLMDEQPTIRAIMAGFWDPRP